MVFVDVGFPVAAAASVHLLPVLVDEVAGVGGGEGFPSGAGAGVGDAFGEEDVEVVEVIELFARGVFLGDLEGEVVVRAIFRLPQSLFMDLVLLGLVRGTRSA